AWMSSIIPAPIITTKMPQTRLAFAVVSGVRSPSRITGFSQRTPDVHHALNGSEIHQHSEQQDRQHNQRVGLSAPPRPGETLCEHAKDGAEAENDVAFRPLQQTDGAVHTQPFATRARVTDHQTTEKREEHDPQDP